MFLQHQKSDNILSTYFSNFKLSFVYWNLRLNIKVHTNKNPSSVVEFEVIKKDNSDLFVRKSQATFLTIG